MHSVHDSARKGLEAWLHRECGRATTYLLRNVSPPGAKPGAIIASPSRSNPDYYFHWVRDSAIAIRAILYLYETSRDPEARRGYLETLMHFVDFSALVQQTARELPVGLGLAKFTVEGRPAPERTEPQDDGPAIRAIEMIRFANLLLQEGRGDVVRDRLYRAELPAETVIKRDLEYVSHRVDQTSFDCWEEVRGYCFFTRFMERWALLEGAALADRLGDPGAASFYRARAGELADALRRHWDPRRGYLVAILDERGSPLVSRSGLDSSVVIATLGGYAIEGNAHQESLYPVDQEHVIATVAELEDVFAGLYPINDPGRDIPGIAIGRYPEDDYNGHRKGALGNPWPSITLAFAMYHHKLADRYRKGRPIHLTAASLPFFERLRIPRARLREGDTIQRGDPRFEAIAEAIERKGDAFLERVRYHANPDGSMSEEINRFTGFQQGARDLSMSYAAFLLAAGMRAQR